MPLLSTKYESASLLAASGNTSEAGIELSVLTRRGNPVTGLDSANFSFASGSVVPPGGTALEIKNVVELPAVGGYNLLVAPHHGHPWKSGVYIEFLQVARDTKRGHEVVKLEIP